MSDAMDKIFVGIFVTIFTVAMGLLVWAVVVMVQGPWYGSGTVVEKTHRGSYISIMSCGKSVCPYSVPECNRLKIVENNGKDHDRCVSRRVWEDAMLGHHITLSEQYN